MAPYEADAQLAFIAINGMIDIVITNDSDLIVHGAPSVFMLNEEYKDKEKQVDGKLIQEENLNKSLRFPEGSYSFDKFRFMCIMNGCDYFKRIKYVGLEIALYVSVIICL